MTTLRYRNENIKLHTTSSPLFLWYFISNIHSRSTRKTSHRPTKLQPYLLPRMYPSHHFANGPPLAACSFQLARRVAMSGLVESRFWDCRLAKRPPPELALERRRSPRLGIVGEVGDLELFEVVESFISLLGFRLI